MSTDKYRIAKAKLLAALAVSNKAHKEAKDAAREKHKELLTAANALESETIAASEKKYAEIMKSAKEKLAAAGNTPAALLEYEVIKKRAYDVLCEETEIAIFRNHLFVKPHRDDEKAAEDANHVAWTAAHDEFYANSSDPDFIAGQAAEDAAMDREIDVIDAFWLVVEATETI
jgi:cation transport regulator ChaB